MLKQPDPAALGAHLLDEVRKAWADHDLRDYLNAVEADIDLMRYFQDMIELASEPLGPSLKRRFEELFDDDGQIALRSAIALLLADPAGVHLDQVAARAILEMESYVDEVGGVKHRG